MSALLGRKTMHCQWGIAASFDRRWTSCYLVQTYSKMSHMNTVRIQFYLPTDLKQQLEELSRATGAPLSELIRRFIFAGLNATHKQ